VCCERGQETLKTDAFYKLKVKSKSLVRSVTSGTSRDFGKNDDDDYNSVSISLPLGYIDVYVDDRGT